MTDWSSDDCSGAGQCHYLVGKARNSTWCHIEKKKIGGITLTLTCILLVLLLLLLPLHNIPEDHGLNIHNLGNFMAHTN
jgi:hypothetical protein